MAQKKLEDKKNQLRVAELQANNSKRSEMNKKNKRTQEIR